MTMTELTKTQKEQLDCLYKSLEIWYHTMVEQQPQLCDGESCSIEFTGGLADTYDANDEPIFAISMDVSSTRTGL